MALLLPLGACRGSAAPTAPSTSMDTSVTLTLHYSAYQPSSLTVPRDRPITVRLRNEDPIAHEWIVGDAAVHEHHRRGTELVHADRLTEVTVPALSERETTVTFAEPGDYAFICHLPGHEAYGMTGVIHVR